jgi:sugar phosphate isomerase/epimerase
MGFVLDDMEASIARYGMPTVRRIFADNGIRHVELEFLCDWHLDGEKRRASDAMYDRLLEVGAELGIGKIKVGGGVFEEGEPDIPAMRATFAALCERAAPFVIDIVIEFLPFARINTIDRGLAILDGLGTTNGGLLVDTWHVERGGMTAADIRKLPLQFLRAVEIDDAGPEVMGTLFNDSTHFRRPPGEGSIDIPAQLQAVFDVGYRGYFGVEIIAAYHRHLPLEIAAQKAFDATMQQFRLVDLPAD